MSAPITRVLIAINAVMFVYTELLQRISTSDLAVIASFRLRGGSFDDVTSGVGGVANGEWWRLVTSGFIHYGLLHLGFNMYTLWQLGHSLEPALGRWRFIGLYVVGLLGGSLGALVFQPFGAHGGASGAVFGLIAAGTLAMRQRGVPFNSTWGPMLLINLVITFTIPGISVGGHIGGMLFGGAAGAIMMHPRNRDRHPQRDLALLIGLSVVGVVLSILVAKSPINGTGLWPR
jgi:membrane associated rhomboid family serine protease